MPTPRLKSLTCLADDGSLVVSIDPKTRVVLDDPDGQIEALLVLLSEGTRDTHQLCVALAETWPGVTHQEIEDALAALDSQRWLEDVAAPPLLDDCQRERYASNLAFFDAFTSLECGREEIQSSLLDAHVVVLGAGGLGSAVVQNLAGLAVGEVTLLDFDKVEPRNFARQFTYTEDHVGRSKVSQLAAWVKAFNSAMVVHAVEARVCGPADLSSLLRGADLLVSAIDQPFEVDLWVNEACVGAGVPFVRGGLSYTQGFYWSVDPGRSACRQCLEAHRSADPDAALLTLPRILDQDVINRAIGPVATMLGALVAMEVLRYLTAIVPPVSAGTYQLVDFAGDCRVSSDPWPADPDCPVCAMAPERARPQLVGASQR